MIITLLVIIAAAEILRLILTHKKHTKKDHFKQKLRGVEKMAWDLEFKLFKTREIREGIRKLYSDNKARLLDLDEKLKDWKEKPEDKPAAEDRKALLTRDLERMESQLKQLDIEIQGTRPTNEYPEGYPGVSGEIDSMVELKGMLENHIKSL